jgi:hypothetical protein
MSVEDPGSVLKNSSGGEESPAAQALNNPSLMATILLMKADGYREALADLYLWARYNPEGGVLEAVVELADAATARLDSMKGFSREDPAETGTEVPPLKENPGTGFLGLLESLLWGNKQGS